MVRKIKVLRIITRLNIGGPAIHATLLTSGLNRDKFNSILATGPVGNSEGDMAYLARAKNINLIIIPELAREVNLRKEVIAFSKLYKLIKKEQPDIIHTHTAKAGALGRLAGLLYRASAFLTLGKKGPKLIHTFHGHVLQGYFGKRKTKIYVWIERILAKFTDIIIVVSSVIKNDLLGLKIGDCDKMKVIPLGIELDGLLELPLNNNSKVTVGIIARLTAIKNHRMFLEAAKFLLTNYKTNNYQLKFVVAGDGELRKSLEAYSKELGLDNYVIFTGWQTDLVGLYSSLDIVGLTSLNEGTPVSLIEAMASARAIVATNVGGVKDLIEPVCNLVDLPEKNILVDSGDIPGFAKALFSLIEDKALRTKIGLAGREFVRNKFSKQRLIDDMEQLYQNLLKES